MSLVIKQSEWVPETSDNTESPIQKSLWVRFSLSNADDNDDISGCTMPPALNKPYYLVLSEPLEIKVETEWTETGGAEIAKKVNQIFNSKAIKAFAGAKANSHAPNENWSQKTTEIGKPLSVKLKFRIYDVSYTETNNQSQTYSEMIYFLTVACAPRRTYNIGGNMLEPLIDAANNSRKFFTDLKARKKAKEEKEKENEQDTDGKGILDDIIESVRLFGEAAKKNLADVRYNYTLNLESEILNSDNYGELRPDWYIKSFTWTPSTEITLEKAMKGKHEVMLPMPLWVDFEVDLETCIVWPQELLSANLVY